MTIKELQLLSEALWESVKTDLKFFSSIQSFVRKLAEFDYTEITKNNLTDIVLYASKIEDFFNRYRSTGDFLYIPPSQTSSNDDTVKRIFDLVSQLGSLNDRQLKKEIEVIKPKSRKKSKRQGLVFIGHGRSKLWARVKIYLEDELGIKSLSFESDTHTSEQIINVLEDFLNKVSYAVLIMTAEDETSEGDTRARQNVIHEAGLFQGRLGFDNVILLKQNGTQEFTNVAGLQYIPFTNENIEQTFYELNRKLKKLGLMK